MSRLLLALLLSSPFTALAQQFEVGIVDFYGLSAPGAPKKKQAEGCLSFRVGTQISAENKSSWYDPTVACLKKLPGVRQAKIEVVCCGEKNSALVFVGVSQQEAKTNVSGDFSSDSRLPAAVIAAYDSLLAGMVGAVQTGQADQDESKGHALFRFPKAREPQRLFADYATTNLSTLRDVLHHARDVKEREVACWVIAYNPNKQEILGDLVSAARDPTEDVRNNAIRALGVLDGYIKKMKLNLKIDPAPFIEMMNSISWTDRNKSSILLLSLTSDRDPGLMAMLKRDALYSLSDMARWKSKGHASQAFFILGRMAGWKNEVIFQRWNGDDRGKWVDEMLKTIGKP